MLGYVYGSGEYMVTIQSAIPLISSTITVQDPSIPGPAGRSLSAMESLGVKVATPVGIIFGQLLFGWLGDLLGRKRICRSQSILLPGSPS